MRLAATVAAALLLLACEDASRSTTPENATLSTPTNGLSASAATLEAEVEFGRDDVGSPFPPGQHDGSFHAFDKLFPRTVVIQRGGSVI